MDQWINGSENQTTIDSVEGGEAGTDGGQDGRWTDGWRADGMDRTERRWFRWAEESSQTEILAEASLSLICYQS